VFDEALQLPAVFDVVPQLPAVFDVVPQLPAVCEYVEVWKSHWKHLLLSGAAVWGLLSTINRRAYLLARPGRQGSLLVGEGHVSGVCGLTERPQQAENGLPVVTCLKPARLQ
jgi:hypothetical protein